MSSATLPASTLPGRVATLYDALGNPVQVTLTTDGVYSLAVVDAALEARLKNLEEIQFRMLLAVESIAQAVKKVGG